MLVLPLDYLEPFAATLGIMLYPGTDEEDRRMAKAFAAHYLAQPIHKLHEAGRSISYEALLRIVTDGGEPLIDLDERWWGGTATGEVFKTYYALANTNRALASWNNAIEIAIRAAVKHKGKGCRTSFMSARRQFGTVAHLWGAWSIREGKFSQQPDVGYDGWADFQSFLAEAEMLRLWGRSWHHSRAKSKPPLPKEAWQVPEDWRPPPRQPGWPQTGGLPFLTLAKEQLTELKLAGRPKKSS